MVRDEMLGAAYPTGRLLCVCGGWLKVYEQPLFPLVSDLEKQYKVTASINYGFFHEGKPGDFCALYKAAVVEMLEKEFAQIVERSMRVFQEEISHGIHGL